MRTQNKAEKGSGREGVGKVGQTDSENTEQGREGVGKEGQKDSENTEQGREGVRQRRGR